MINFMRFPVLFASLLMCLLALSGCNAQDKATETAVQNWFTQNATPIHVTDNGAGTDDLEAIADFIGDARLVCLGESRHDIREQCLFKNRLVKRLVEKEGFRVFILEESLPFARDLNAYIHGSAANPDSLFNQMGSWFIWDTEEMHGLFKWMRAYNEQAVESDKLHFYGCDITHPEPGIEQIQRYLDIIDPDFALRFEEFTAAMPVWNTSSWMELIQRYATLSPADVDSLHAFWEGMQARFVEREKEYMREGSKAEFKWIKLQINSIISVNEMFLLAGAGQMNEAGTVREHGMAANLKWVLDKYPEETRMIHWAHNLHVGRSTFDMEMQGRPKSVDLPTMIVVLEQEMEIDLLTIGFSSARTDDEQWDFQAAEPGMLDALLSEACSGPSFIDLKADSDNDLVKKWLNTKQWMLSQGGIAKVVPAQMFDGIVFIPDATKSTLSSLAQEKMRLLPGPGSD